MREASHTDFNISLFPPDSCQLHEIITLSSAIAILYPHSLQENFRII